MRTEKADDRAEFFTFAKVKYSVYYLLKNVTVGIVNNKNFNRHVKLENAQDLALGNHAS